MDKQDLKKTLLTAKNSEDVRFILSKYNIEIPNEDADRLFDSLQMYRSQLSNELSEDELAAIGGGRDYATDGCAASVEPGSSCWGLDGGCAVIHYHYDNRPLRLYCKKDGTPLYRFECPPEDLFAYKYRCRVCGTEYTDFDFIPD